MDALKSAVNFHGGAYSLHMVSGLLLHLTTLSRLCLQIHQMHLRQNRDSWHKSQSHDSWHKRLTVVLVHSLMMRIIAEITCAQFAVHDVYFHLLTSSHETAGRSRGYRYG